MITNYDRLESAIVAGRYTNTIGHKQKLYECLIDFAKWAKNTEYIDDETIEKYLNEDSGELTLADLIDEYENRSINKNLIGEIGRLTDEELKMIKKYMNSALFYNPFQDAE